MWRRRGASLGPCVGTGGLGDPQKEDGVWEGISEMETLVAKRRAWGSGILLKATHPVLLAGSVPVFISGS